MRHGGGARRAGVVLAAVGLLVSGCGTAPLIGGIWPVAADSAEVVAPVAAVTPEPTPVAPLTGLPVETAITRPALAVKVENPAVARPQAGLAEADIVWEQVVEGGVSRFVAVYQSQLPASIGPVRSARPMDPAIAAPLRGLFATSGGQGQYLRAVVDGGLQLFSFDAGDDGLARRGFRPAPHNVHVDPAALYAQADADHQAAPTAQFAYAPTAGTRTTVTQGTAASALDLVLSGEAVPSWDWNAATRAWDRSEGATPAHDADGARLSATNVVVLRVDVVGTAAVDPAGNPVPMTLLSGHGGQALIATGGRTVTATWSKDTDTDPVVLTAPDGTTVLLAPGATWVELVPTGSGSVTVVP